MTTQPMDPSSPYENVVVLMLENRSFDNLLGYLYEDGVPAGKNYAGLQEGDFANPIPSRIKEENQPKLAPHKATNYHQPYPDPGEEYQHINTQLFNHVDSDNIGVTAIRMKPPFNLPANLPEIAPMNGFVNDYINTLQGMGNQTFKNPSYEQYSVIMQCFKPDQVSVTSGLAKEFAVFDHWFCSVPSQTWCNRAFWHAATSGGFVINPLQQDDETLLEDVVDMYKWMEKMWSKPTLFSLLKGKDIQNGLYSDNFVALTHLVNGFENVPLAKGMDSFYQDLQEGKLPQYSFIEPKFMGQHNDQHPCAFKKGTEGTKVGTVLLGEKLIHDVYSAIKNSDQYRDKTLFIITQDEHGGCFDHVSPPKAVSPEPGMKGQNGFNFDRLGVRVPMIMISSYISPNTIVNDTFDHTSFLHTMSEKWDLGHLTERDKQAKSFSSVFSTEKRDWPEIAAPQLPKGYEKEDYSQDPLNNLQKSILHNTAAFIREKQKLVGDELEKSKKEFESIKIVGDAINYLKKIKGFF